MIHIITNHHETPKWLKLQAQYLDRNTDEKYKVYCGLTDMQSGAQVEPTPRYSFYSLQVPNIHADKLNALYKGITECHDDDLLVFLDPDALVSEKDWDVRMREYLKDHSAVAISREENIELGILILLKERSVLECF